MRPVRAVLGVSLAIALVGLLASSASAAPAQPDALIRRAGDTGWSGKDIYNTDGADQTILDANTLDAEVKIQNDSAKKDTFVLKADTVTNEDGTVTILRHGKDVTDKLLDGKLRFENVKPHKKSGKLLIELRTPNENDDAEALITAKSERKPNEKDAVKAMAAGCSVC